MIVVAIIGILAAIAIPAYQNYTIRAQVTEGLTLADGWKTAIAEYYANTGNWPSVGNLTGTTNSIGKYESSVTVKSSGVIEITYGGQANAKLSGEILDLVPYTNANNDVLWQCGHAAAPSGGSARSRRAATRNATTCRRSICPPPATADRTGWFTRRGKAPAPRGFLFVRRMPTCYPAVQQNAPARAFVPRIRYWERIHAGYPPRYATIGVEFDN